MTISRFKELYDTSARAHDILWPDLFKEFSKKVPFQGDKHPGWSPAEFDPPQRALENVRQIHALALDYDNKTKSGDRVEHPFRLEDAEEMFADYYALIHTTRHHTADWPRFRVILPLYHSVDRLGYTTLWQAAARRWPGLDPQPKDPSRFWFTPGMADIEGADFAAITLTGEYLDPQKFVSENPVIATPSTTLPPPDSQRETRARAYIEKMPPAVSGANGHAALFAVARKLVCGFGLDEQAAMRLLVSEYNPRCSPAWTEKELRHKVKQAAEKATVRDAVPDRPKPEASNVVALHPRVTKAVTVGNEWMKFLHHDMRDRLTKDVGNVTLILKNSPHFRGCLMFDSMAARISWHTAPEHEVGLKPPMAGETLADHHIAYVQHVLVTQYGLSVGKEIVWSAIDAAAHESSIHPVQEYLSGLQWDGVKRVDKWLHTYLSAEDNEYNNSVGKWWLISAVARAKRPGCQADHVLILEGKQGKGKSQAIKSLGNPWVTDSLPDLRDNAKAIEAISGQWIVEIAELDALKGASMTRVKSFVTQQVDKYRPPYAHAGVERPRSCVFIGTTNDSTYLSDPTGARRFWPVNLVGRILQKQIREDRDQLWAEAQVMFDSGEQWHPTEQMLDVISEEQADRYAEDDWASVIQRWILARGADEHGFTSEEILREALNLEMRLWDRSAQTRVGGILTKLNYVRKRSRIGTDRSYRYFPAG